MNPRIAFIDFETRSTVDLKKVGVEKYAEDPSTEALCICWKFNTSPELFDAKKLEIADSGRSLFDVDNLLRHVASGGLVVAHNARFEINIWRMLSRRYDWPELKAEQVHDTMAMARVLTLPGGLGELARALRLPVEKDDAGRRLMLKMCKPRKHEPQDAIIWHEDPADVQRLVDYCRRDVEVEEAIYNTLPKLTPAAHALWVLDQRINDRGIYIDRDAAIDLLHASDAELERLNGELRQITEGALRTVGQAAKLLEWLAANGCPLPDTKKGTIAAALKRNVSARVRRVLEIRQEANKASTKKLKPMVESTCADSRAKGLLEFHGAGTGRWAGRRIQPQNMVRTPEDFKVADAENVISWGSIDGGEIGMRAEYGSALDAISWSSGSLIMAAPGFEFLSADYSNIEGRVLAWLAGEQWKLEFFANYDAAVARGEKPADNYMVAYSKSFGVPLEQVTKPQRQIGKVQELALGYQGGHGAFLSMGANYGIDLDAIAAAVRDAVTADEWDTAQRKYWEGAREDAEEMLADMRTANLASDDDNDEDALVALETAIAQSNRFNLTADQWSAIRIIVDGWRSAHDATVQFWYALDRAVVDAVSNPGEVVVVGKVRYKMVGKYLYCRLPSGRCLAYPYAEVVKTERKIKVEGGEKVLTSLKVEYEGTDSKTKRWVKQRLYGGLLAENITQAVACDVLSDAMRRLESAGYPIVLHVHDEIVSEVRRGDSGKTLAEFYKLMAAKEHWAEGLPVAVDGWQGQRYRK